MRASFLSMDKISGTRRRPFAAPTRAPRRRTLRRALNQTSSNRTSDTARWETTASRTANNIDIIFESPRQVYTFRLSQNAVCLPRRSLRHNATVAFSDDEAKATNWLSRPIHRPVRIRERAYDGLPSSSLPRLHTLE